MRLSIIIPVYNVEKYIAECLESALDQGMDTKDYEIIIVSDGSTDSSVKIAQSYAEVNENIIIIEKENGGIGSARHSGMDCAKGKYIYFLDSDDYLVSNSLNNLVNICELKNLDILTFNSKTVTSISQKDESTSKQTNFNSFFEENMLSQIVTGEQYVANVKYRSEAWSYLTNREFLTNTGIRFVEGRYLEDVVFSIKLFLEAIRMANLKFYAHRYRIHTGGAMTSKKSSHYLNIIRDLQYAVLGFEPVIEALENKNANQNCINRVKERQQSLLFFSMMRMFKSRMSFDEVKMRMTEMTSTKAYPFSSSRKDYSGVTYKILYHLFRTKYRFYFFFLIFNPILRSRFRF